MKRPNWFAAGLFAAIGVAVLTGVAAGWVVDPMQIALAGFIAGCQFTCAVLEVL